MRRKPMQVAIETIVEKAGKLNEYKAALKVGNEFHLKIENGEGYQPLSINVIGVGLVSVAHTYVQYGDLMYDPEIVFNVNMRWLPVSFTQSGTGYHAEAGNGRYLVLGGFDKVWARNIKHQGYIEAASN